MNKSSAGKQQAVDLVYLLKVFRNNLLWILVAALLAENVELGHHAAVALAELGLNVIYGLQCLVEILLVNI